MAILKLLLEEEQVLVGRGEREPSVTVHSFPCAAICTLLPPLCPGCWVPQFTAYIPPFPVDVRATQGSCLTDLGSLGDPFLMGDYLGNGAYASSLSPEFLLWNIHCISN